MLLPYFLTAILSLLMSFSVNATLTVAETISSLYELPLTGPGTKTVCSEAQRLSPSLQVTVKKQLMTHRISHIQNCIDLLCLKAIKCIKSGSRMHECQEKTDTIISCLEAQNIAD